MEAPPSPEYIPGPEAPPSPDYIPGPEYPEHPLLADDVVPAEEQPLPAAVLPIAESPGYITESEPEMEPEEDDGDNEKSEGDSIEYPTSRGDDDADDDGIDHITRQYTQSKKVQWLKQKMMLAQIQEAGIQLSKEQLTILADTRERVNSRPCAFTVITNALFQSDGIDLFDSYCDEVPTTQASFMANLSSYGSDVPSKVPHSKTYQNDMANQSVQAMPYFKQKHVVDYPDNEITSDSNIIQYSQYLLETQHAVVQDTNSSAQQDSMILSMVEQMTDHVANLDKEN
nr:hypothetical protein [Tanacetum cinerariifolium]